MSIGGQKPQKTELRINIRAQEMVMNRKYWSD
jgi:hypothetical protein